MVKYPFRSIRAGDATVAGSELATRRRAKRAGKNQDGEKRLFPALLGLEVGYAIMYGLR